MAARLTDDSAKIIVPAKEIRLTCCRKSDNNGGNSTEHYEITEMEADHITPWHLGGKTSADNCQMISKDYNRRKSGK